MRRSVVLSLVIVALFATSCRSRVKPAATPAPAPQPVAERIEDPSADFGTPAQRQPQDDLAGQDVDRVARERGWIRDAFFGFDSTTLDADARAALDTSARWLRDQPRVRVTIEGHCDERGTEQYNLALGDRRAETARQYLAALGVDPDRISTVSYGEERPFAHGSNEEAWQQNRRAHIRVEQR